MELIIDVFNYALTAILIGVCGAWIFLIKSMVNSFRFTPYLDKFENTSKTSPKVSIILPARNEENFIGKCLDSLIKQDYENYEIIVIDDSSDDQIESHNNDASDGAAQKFILTLIINIFKSRI